MIMADTCAHANLLMLNGFLTCYDCGVIPELAEEELDLHSADAACAGTIGDDGCCTVCGVSHDGPPCNECGGVAFHVIGCPEWG